MSSTSSCTPACTGTTPICADSKCVQCSDNTQCVGGSDHVCSADHMCVNCVQDDQCVSASSGDSGFCINQHCTFCTAPTLGDEASVCATANACCFDQLTGGIQPCASNPSQVLYDSVDRRCIFDNAAPQELSGDWCRSSFECGDAAAATRTMFMRNNFADPYSDNADIISQFGSMCRDTKTGAVVNCIEANMADAGSSLGCTGLQHKTASSRGGECVFCPSGSDQTACTTYIPQ